MIDQTRPAPDAAPDAAPDPARTTTAAGGVSPPAAAPLSRRQALAGIGSAAAATTAYAALARGAEPASRPAVTNPFPTNPDLQKLFPDHYDPPASDGGDVKPFWYSFDLGHNKVSDGGWARQVTVKDLPVSTTIAGVNMRLNKGAIREAHWHVAAEWAYMLSGQCRVSVVAPDGKGYAADVGPGDLWYFPSGHPHTLQGIGDDGCEFLIVFDNGSASEFDTFLITDWMHHTPREVLAKNFGLPTSTFDPVPSKELYIFSSDLPGPLAQDKTDVCGADGETPEPFTYRMLAGPPDVQGKSGEVRIVDSTKFKVSTTVAAAHVKLRPGGLRELHWHTNQDEWQYYVAGQGRMTVFNGNGAARTMDFKAGDVGYVQDTLPHYVENTGDTDLVFLEIFKSPIYRDISLTQWITHLTPTMVKAHLGIDKATLLQHVSGKPVVVPTT